MKNKLSERNKHTKRTEMKENSQTRQNNNNFGIKQAQRPLVPPHGL